MSENHFLEAGLWFFSGVMAHKIGARIFLNSYAHIFLEEAVVKALSVLRYADQNVEAAMKVSHEAHSSAKTEEEIEEIKSNDETFLRFWRLHSIKTLLNHCTPALRNKLSFENWFQAMNYLDKKEKKL